MKYALAFFLFDENRGLKMMDLILHRLKTVQQTVLTIITIQVAKIASLLMTLSLELHDASKVLITRHSDTFTFQTQMAANFFSTFYIWEKPTVIADMRFFKSTGMLWEVLQVSINYYNFISSGGEDLILLLLKAQVVDCSRF